MNTKVRHNQIETPGIGRHSGDVGIPQHPLEVLVREVAPGFLKHLVPSGDSGAMPGELECSSGACRTMVTHERQLGGRSIRTFLREGPLSRPHVDAQRTRFQD